MSSGARINRVRGLVASTLLAAVLLSVASAPARAEEPFPDEGYRAVVRELLSVTGALELGRQLASGFVQSTVKSASATGHEISPEAARIIQETAEEYFAQIFSIEEVVELQSTTYAKHFTKAELEELLAFYRTPLGAKMIRAMPKIAMEVMAFTQKKAVETMPAVEAELKRRLDQAGLQH